jgi:hypothetical protein
MRIVTSPWRAEFNALVGVAENTVRLVTPYYSSNAVAEFLRCAEGRRKFILLALDEQGVKGNFQSTSAIRAILKDPDAEVRFIRNLHAKFVIADEHAAIVTSANLTGGGLEKNIEVGVRFADPNGVGKLVDHFNALWAKAAPINQKDLAHFDALPRAKGRHGKRGRAHGPIVRIRRLPKDPASPGTPALGWIIVHSEEAYKREGRWQSPIHQLKEIWKPGMRELDWGWTSPRMNESSIPRRVLLAWKGAVFGHAIATIREASEDEIADGSEFFFVLRKFKRARLVPFAKLPLGHRRRHHRGLMRLDEKVLAAYWSRSK